MPELLLNLDAVEHNLRTLRTLEQTKGFRILPVVKMCAAYPPLLALLEAQGYTTVGVADMEESRNLAFQRILINLWPLRQAREVAATFSRSPVSSLEGLRALDEAATALGVRHSALIMLDIGDGREGILPEKLPEILTQAARENFTHAVPEGLGVSLACLAGTWPDHRNMSVLQHAVHLMENILGYPPAVVSVGGSVFLDWLIRKPGFLSLAPETRLELRTEAPMLLGFDDYRNQAFAEGDFRRDTLSLTAEVLEVKTGSGCARLLLDCGTLHTDMADMQVKLSCAHFVGTCANYSVLEVSWDGEFPRRGDKVFFTPGLYAAGRAFRSQGVRKSCHRSREGILMEISS